MRNWAFSAGSPTLWTIYFAKLRLTLNLLKVSDSIPSLCAFIYDDVIELLRFTSLLLSIWTLKLANEPQYRVIVCVAQTVCFRSFDGYLTSRNIMTYMTSWYIDLNIRYWIRIYSIYVYWTFFLPRWTTEKNQIIVRNFLNKNGSSYVCLKIGLSWSGQFLNTHSSLPQVRAGLFALTLAESSIFAWVFKSILRPLFKHSVEYFEM